MLRAILNARSNRSPPFSRQRKKTNKQERADGNRQGFGSTQPCGSRTVEFLSISFFFFYFDIFRSALRNRVSTWSISGRWTESHGTINKRPNRREHRTWQEMVPQSLSSQIWLSPRLRCSVPNKVCTWPFVCLFSTLCCIKQEKRYAHSIYASFIIYMSTVNCQS